MDCSWTQALQTAERKQMWRNGVQSDDLGMQSWVLRGGRGDKTVKGHVRFHDMKDLESQVKEAGLSENAKK